VVGLLVVGLLVRLSATGFGDCIFVGGCVAGTTKGNSKGATGLFDGTAFGAVVDGTTAGPEVTIKTIPAFQEKSDSPDSRTTFSVRPVSGTVKL